MERGSINCTDLDPLQRLKLYVAIEAVFAVISSLACLFTIVLFVVVQAYRSYVHRLTLYLAITKLFFSVSLGLSVTPIDTGRYPISPRPGWNDASRVYRFWISDAILRLLVNPSDTVDLRQHIRTFGFQCKDRKAWL